MRYSKILYKIQVEFTIAYPDENPKMHFSYVNRKSLIYRVLFNVTCGDGKVLISQHTMY